MAPQPVGGLKPVSLSKGLTVMAIYLIVGIANPMTDPWYFWRCPWSQMFECHVTKYTLLNPGIIVPKGAQAWTQQKGVYFAAAGRSFYEQCFPNNSVHIGLSSHAVHFLSKRYETFNTSSTIYCTPHEMILYSENAYEASTNFFSPA